MRFPLTCLSFFYRVTYVQAALLTWKPFPLQIAMLGELAQHHLQLGLL